MTANQNVKVGDYVRITEESTPCRKGGSKVPQNHGNSQSECAQKTETASEGLSYPITLFIRAIRDICWQALRLTLIASSMVVSTGRFRRSRPTLHASTASVPRTPPNPCASPSSVRPRGAPTPPSRRDIAAPCVQDQVSITPYFASFSILTGIFLLLGGNYYQIGYCAESRN